MHLKMNFKWSYSSPHAHSAIKALREGNGLNTKIVSSIWLMMTNPLHLVGDAIDTFDTYQDVEDAFMAGKDLQANVDITSCSGDLPPGLMVNSRSCIP